MFAMLTPSAKRKLAPDLLAEYVQQGKTPPKRLRHWGPGAYRLAAGQQRGQAKITRRAERAGAKDKSFAERLIARGVVGQFDRELAAKGREVMYGSKNPSLGRVGAEAALALTPGGIGKLARGAQALRAARGVEKGAEAVKAGRTAARAAEEGRAGARAVRVPGQAAKKAPWKGVARHPVRSAAGGAAKAAGRTRPGRAIGRAARTAERTRAGRQAARVLKPTGRFAGKHPIAAAAVTSPATTQTPGTPESLRRLATTPYQLGKATVQHPGTVGRASAVSLRDALFGAPAAVKEIVTNPKGAASAIVEDYKHRYGPLLEGDEAEFRRRVEKSGLTPFAFDALVAGPPAGRVAGKAARSGVAGRRIQQAAAGDRPALRVAAEEAHPQKTSKNLFTAAGQKSLDIARKRRERRRPGRQGIKSGRGEVVPLRQRKRLRVSAAREKGYARHQQLAEQAEQIGRGTQKQAAKLTKHERRAAKYMIQLGIRADPKHADEVLAERETQILAAREAEAQSRATKLAKRRNKQAKKDGRAATAKPEHFIDEIREQVAPAKGHDELNTIRKLRRRKEKSFTPAAEGFARGERQRAKRVAQGDPGVNLDQAARRAYKQQAEYLGVSKVEGESAAEFVSRVRVAAKKRGLNDPGYFPSQLQQGAKFSDYAVGGAKAVAGPRHYSGKLFRLGYEDPSIDALSGGLARGIKRKFNWNLVADQYGRHSFAWSRDRSIPDLLRELKKRGIPENEVAFVNPGILRREQRGFAKGDSEIERSGAAEDIGVEGLREGIEASARPGDKIGGLATEGADFAQTRGWQIVPREVYDEIHSSARQSLPGRILDVATQKQSRFLLGAANLPWLQFQIASNALLTGFAGTGPLDLVKAQVWWRKLTPEQRKDVEPYVGIGHFQSDIRQTKLGASTNRGIVNGYRALKETTGGKKIWGRTQVRDLNPLDALFRVDNAQNNFFRRAVLYSQVKRQAYRSMGEHAGEIGALQSRLMNTMRLGPEKQMQALLKDRRALEEHAATVNDFLGDYLTYTSRERAYLKRSVIFYGFLRFSLRFTFYTMPVRHPMVTGILGNLARMKAAEVKELLGGDELPYALGRFYYGPGGEFVVDMQRANPVLNALSQAAFAGGLEGKLGGASGLFPPVYGALISQAANKDIFTGKDFLVRGETSTRKLLGIGLGDRGRIALRQAGEILYPYRLWEQLAFEGQPQGADSLAFSPRGTEYKDPALKAKLAKNAKAISAQGLAKTTAQSLFPIGGLAIPGLREPSHDRAIAASIRARRKEEARALGITGGSSSSSSSSGGAPWKGGGSVSTSKAPWKVGGTVSSAKAPWK